MLLVLLLWRALLLLENEWRLKEEQRDEGTQRHTHEPKRTLEVGGGWCFAVFVGGCV
jgi:hypothetical protein